MGMFDYLKCEYPISAPDTVREWQTKDTPEQYLATYKIDAAGELWFHKVDREYVDNGKKGLEGLLGCMKVIGEEWIKQPDFRGEIRFYGNERIDGRDEHQKWWEYSALFDDGKLISMKPLCEGNEP